MKLTKSDIANIEAVLTDYETMTAAQLGEKMGLTTFSARTLILSLKRAGVSFPRKKAPARFRKLQISEVEAFRAWQAANQAARS